MVRYFKPETLPELLMLLNDEETRFPLLAGGTDILVQWRMASFTPQGVIDIGSIEELKLIIERDNVIEIGALVSHFTIVESKIAQRNCPVLVDACKTVGAVQIQNRGTIGGNIVTASPAGDTPPALMAFDAQLELKSLTNIRRIPVKDFYLTYRKTALKSDEILTRIIIPKQRENERAAFYKVGTRKAQAISKVVMCVRSRITNGVSGYFPQQAETCHHDPLSPCGRGRKAPLGPRPFTGLGRGGTFVSLSPPLPRQGGGELVTPQQAAGDYYIDDIAIALGSVAPTVICAPKTEAFLKGKKLDAPIINEAKRLLSSEIQPIDDIRSTADYRKFVAGNLLARYLTDITSRFPSA